jgi:hypothetical protein
MNVLSQNQYSKGIVYDSKHNIKIKCVHLETLQCQREVPF